MKRTAVLGLMLLCALAGTSPRAETLAAWDFENAKLGSTDDFAPGFVKDGLEVSPLREYLGNSNSEAHPAATNKIGVRDSTRATTRKQGEDLVPDGRFLEIGYASTPQISKTDRNAPAHGYFLECGISSKKGTMSLEEILFVQGVDHGKERKSVPSMKVFISVDNGKVWRNVTPGKGKFFYLGKGRLADKGYTLAPRAIRLDAISELKAVPAGSVVRIAFAFGDGAVSDGKAHIFDNIKIMGRLAD